MHLAERGYFLIALTAVLAITGAWSGDPGMEWAWCWPAALLCAGLAIEAWLTPHVQILAEIRFEQRLLLGRVTTASFSLRHDLPRTLTVQYARLLPAALAGDAKVTDRKIPASAEASERWRVRPVRLGPAACEPLPARVLGRLGLAWWSRTLPLPVSFNVAPDSLYGVRARTAGDVRGDAVRAAPGHGRELFQLRDYVPGDPLSRIDWKASARARALIARDMSEDQHLEIVVVVDAGRMSKMRVGELDRLGVYANIAARFAEHAARLDDRVGLVAYADRVLARCPPGRGLVGVRRVRDTLEQLVSERTESQPAVAAQAVLQMLRSRSLVVWLTDLGDPLMIGALQAATALLLPRHVVICAGLDSSALLALAERPAQNWRDPWIALAARAESDRIARQTGVLAGAGAAVVIAEERHLEQAVLSAYRQRRRQRRV
ncbi:MAG: DUF58 domain-containing protein [Steroidobacteraceae bacterium]